MVKETKKIALAIMISAVMVISVMGLIGGLSGAPLNLNTVSGTGVVKTSPEKAVNINTPLSQGQESLLAKEVLQEARQTGVEMNHLFIPNYMSKSTVTEGHITLGYACSPAPMGVGDYGLENVSGVLQTYNCTPSDIAAVVNLSELSVLTNDGTLHQVSMQLNAVLNNVDLFGESNYSFWTQNVIDYSARSHLMCFVDNIWNFSSPTAKLTTNAINYSSAIASGKGFNNYAVGVHIGCGPQVIVPTPFLLYLYLNTSLVDGKSTVWFNYSLPQMSMHGTYDEVEFNSTYGQKVGYSAPAPHYLISGTELTPEGRIPYDAEMMIGGPGGGSTADISNISGTINLMVMNSTTGEFQNVKAAYDIGSQTGETSVGVDVSYKGSTAVLMAGPSLVYGLWNNTYSWTSYKIDAVDESMNYQSVDLTGNVQQNFAGDLMYMQTHPSTYGSNNNISAFYAAYNATDLFLGFQENISGNSLVLLISNHSIPYGAENLSTYSPWGLSGMNTDFPVNEIFSAYFSGNTIETNKFCAITSKVGQTITTTSVPYSIVTSAKNNTTEISVPLKAIMGNNSSPYPDLSFAAFVVGGSGYYVGTGIPFKQVGTYDSAPPHIFLVNNTLNTLSTITPMPFMFVENNLTFMSFDIMAWSPTSSFVLPTSTYYFESLLDYYTPQNGVLLNGNQTTYVDMKYNMSVGYYTPLYLMNNQDIKTFAVGGDGTSSDPYVLSPEGLLNPLFGQLNDYAYPVFQGLIIQGTTTPFVVSDYLLGLLYEGFWGKIVSFYDQHYNLNLPGYNSPSVMVYNASNVEFYSGTFITWFPCTDAFSDIASLVLWNSTGINVFYSHFVSYGDAMLVYNPPSVDASIQIMGNYFVGINPEEFYKENYSISQQAAFASSFDLGTAQIGLRLYSGGNIIFLNEFITQTPVLSCDVNYYTGQSAVYHDLWNNTTTGNAYWNYNFVTPFNESGLIQTGFDYHPDSFVTGDNLTFTTGSGIPVEVSVAGLLLKGTSNVTFYKLFEPGTLVHYYAEYMTGPLVTGQGSVVIQNVPTTVVNLSEVVLTNNVTFYETGLPSGTTWTVNIDGKSTTTSNSSLTFSLPDGNYTYTITSTDPFYVAHPSTGYVNLTETMEVSTVFTYVAYNLTFDETGLPSGSTWYVNISGVAKSSSGTSITFTEPNGTYSYVAYAKNKTYAPTAPSGTVTINGSSQTVSLTFQLLKFSLTFDEKGLSSGAKWYVNLSNGMSLSSTGASISFNLTNGTYSYIATSSGYLNKTGNITISGSSIVLTLSFTAVSPPVKVAHKPLSYLVYVLIVVIIATVVVAALLVMRFRR